MTSDESVVRELLRDHKDLIPSPYGADAAAEGVGSVAAPLFAGFALTMATIVLTTPGPFRWPEAVLLTQTIAVVALIGSVQAAQSARSYRVTPAEAASWWPDASRSDLDALKDELASHARTHRIWDVRQRRLYRIGIVALLWSLAAALVPNSPAGDVPVIRWLALAVAVFGAVAEMLWLMARYLAGKPEGPKMAGLTWRIKRAARGVMGES